MGVEARRLAWLGILKLGGMGVLVVMLDGFVTARARLEVADAIRRPFRTSR